MPVKPPAPRNTIENSGNALLISIPSHKDWSEIVFLGFWLAAWAFGEVIVSTHFISDLLNSNSQDPFVFIAAWLGLWTLGGVFAIYCLLWQLFGKEEIQINTRSIVVDRVVLFLRFSKEYSSKFIKDLRISSVSINRHWCMKV